MPKLRKQNIGRHCQSAFQFFLVDRLFPSPEEMDAEEMMEDLRVFLGREPGCEGAQVGDWSRVGYENYEGFLIQGCVQHNFVVMIVALIDLLVDTTHFYIQSIHDPLHAFIEFNLRYCLFRNVILSLEVISVQFRKGLERCLTSTVSIRGRRRDAGWPSGTVPSRSGTSTCKCATRNSSKPTFTCSKR